MSHGQLDDSNSGAEGYDVGESQDMDNLSEEQSKSTIAPLRNIETGLLWALSSPICMIGAFLGSSQSISPSLNHVLIIQILKISH